MNASCNGTSLEAFADQTEVDEGREQRWLRRYPSPAWGAGATGAKRPMHPNAAVRYLDPRNSMVSAIPEEVRRFVRAYIRSMLQLESLLLLARDPERWWTAAAVNREARASTEASLHQLERLAELGLLEQRATEPKEFRFRPTDSGHPAIVATLRELHTERFHALVDMIYARDRAEEFAEAFRIKMGKKDG